MATAATFIGLLSLLVAIPFGMRLFSNYSSTIDFVTDNANTVISFIKGLPDTINAFMQTASYIVPVYVLVPVIGIVYFAAAVFIVRLFSKIMGTLTFRS